MISISSNTRCNLRTENARDFAIGRLGMSPEVLYGYEHLDERTRYIYRTVGIEESYWPAYLKNP